MSSVFRIHYLLSSNLDITGVRAKLHAWSICKRYCHWLFQADLQFPSAFGFSRVLGLQVLGDLASYNNQKPFQSFKERITHGLRNC